MPPTPPRHRYCSLVQDIQAALAFEGRVDEISTEKDSSIGLWDMVSDLFGGKVLRQ